MTTGQWIAVAGLAATPLAFWAGYSLLGEWLCRRIER